MEAPIRKQGPDARAQRGAGCVATALLVLSGCWPLSSARAVEPLPDTASQRALFGTFQMCAALGLPENLKAIKDADAAAATAATKCRTERLALAGQFALDNPGSRQIGRFMEAQHQRVVDILSDWIEASAGGDAPHPSTPR